MESSPVQKPKQLWLEVQCRNQGHTVINASFLFVSLFLRAWQIQRGNKAREEQSRHSGASISRANDTLSNINDEARAY